MLATMFQSGHAVTVTASPERLVRFAQVVSAVSLGLAAWTGVMVTRRYRPDGGAPVALLPSSARWSRQLVDWHAASVSVAVVALAVWCGLMVAGHGWRSRHAARAVGSTIGTVAVLGSSVVAWQRVHWEQLGLRAVTADSDVSGLWYAAFSNDVRFVFVGRSGELSQSDVAPWVVVYLLAPFLALGLFGIGWVTTRPGRVGRRSVVTVEA